MGISYEAGETLHRAQATRWVYDCGPKERQEDFQCQPQWLVFPGQVTDHQVTSLRDRLCKEEQLAADRLTFPKDNPSQYPDMALWAKELGDGLHYFELNPLTVLRIKLVFETLHYRKEEVSKISRVARELIQTFKYIDRYLVTHDEKKCAPAIDAVLKQAITECGNSSKKGKKAIKRASKITDWVEKLKSCFADQKVNHRLTDLITPLHSTRRWPASTQGCRFDSGKELLKSLVDIIDLLIEDAILHKPHPQESFDTVRQGWLTLKQKVMDVCKNTQDVKGLAISDFEKLAKELEKIEEQHKGVFQQAASCLEQSRAQHDKGGGDSLFVILDSALDHMNYMGRCLHFLRLCAEEPSKRQTALQVLKETFQNVISTSPTHFVRISDLYYLGLVHALLEIKTEGAQESAINMYIAMLEEVYFCQSNVNRMRGDEERRDEWLDQLRLKGGPLLTGLTMLEQMALSFMKKNPNLKNTIPWIQMTLLIQDTDILAGYFAPLEESQYTIFDHTVGLVDFFLDVAKQRLKRIQLPSISHLKSKHTENARFQKLVMHSCQLVSQMHGFSDQLLTILPEKVTNANQVQQLAKRLVPLLNHARRQVEASEVYEEVCLYLRDLNTDMRSLEATNFGLSHEMLGENSDKLEDALSQLYRVLKKCVDFVPTLEDRYFYPLIQINRYQSLLGDLKPQIQPLKKLNKPVFDSQEYLPFWEDVKHFRSVVKRLDQVPLQQERAEVCHRVCKDMLFHLVAVTECLLGQALWQLRSLYEASALLLEGALRYNLARRNFIVLKEKGLKLSHDLCLIAKELNITKNLLPIEQAQEVIEQISRMHLPDPFFDQGNQEEIIKRSKDWIMRAKGLMKSCLKDPLDGLESAKPAQDFAFEPGGLPLDGITQGLNRILRRSNYDPRVPISIDVEERQPEIRRQVMGRCVAKIELTLPRFQDVFGAQFTFPFAFGHAKQALLTLSQLNHAVLLYALAYLPIPEEEQSMYHICRAKVGNRPLSYHHNAYELLKPLNQFLENARLFKQIVLSKEEKRALRFLSYVPRIYSRYLYDQPGDAQEPLIHLAEISDMMSKGPLSPKDKAKIDDWKKDLPVGPDNDESQIMKCQFDKVTRTINEHCQYGLTALGKCITWVETL